MGCQEEKTYLTLTSAKKNVSCVTWTPLVRGIKTFLSLVSLLTTAKIRDKATVNP
jgi:hypothetical protein